MYFVHNAESGHYLLFSYCHKVDIVCWPKRIKIKLAWIKIYNKVVVKIIAFPGSVDLLLLILSEF